MDNSLLEHRRAAKPRPMTSANGDKAVVDLMLKAMYGIFAQAGEGLLHLSGRDLGKPVVTASGGAAVLVKKELPLCAA